MNNINIKMNVLAGKRIFVVEDDIVNASMLRKYLVKHGAFVSEDILGHGIVQRIIDSLPIDMVILDIPYCHHEKWDGTGCPRGLKGEGILLAARIFAVVDVWDAMLSELHYRSARMLEDVKMRMLKQTGQHFDPQII
jgi:hypothetical protein